MINQPSWYDYMGLAEGDSSTNVILGVINGLYAAGEHSVVSSTC